MSADKENGLINVNAATEVLGLSPGTLRVSRASQRKIASHSKEDCRREASGGRVMCTYGPLFDLAAGEAEKDAGRARAVTKRRDSLLAFARDAVRRAAASRSDRLATSDDAYSLMAELGKDAAELGNAAGSIFNGDAWEAVGWKPSKRKSNHARMIREWRLRG